MSSAIQTASALSFSSAPWLTGFLAATLLGCGSVSVESRRAGLRGDYVHIGEGVTVTGPNADAEFASRTFTIYLLDEACRNSRAEDVVRLRAQPSRLTLHVGEPFSLGSVKITALGAADVLLPKVPVAVELKSRVGVFDYRFPWGESGVLQQDALVGGALMPRTPARVIFRFRMICPGPAAEVFVEAEIRRR
jgi:hypothetical protein